MTYKRHVTFRVDADGARCFGPATARLLHRLADELEAEMDIFPAVASDTARSELPSVVTFHGGPWQSFN